MSFADLDQKAKDIIKGPSEAAAKKAEEMEHELKRVTGEARERRARESTRK